MKRNKILITGGAGFLGLNLALEVAKDYRVCLFDNLQRKPAGDLDRAKQCGIELVQGDVRDKTALADAVKDADLVVHMAAIAGVPNYYKAPYEVMQVNIGGTLNLIEFLTKGTQRLIFMSSSEVYGINAQNAQENQSLIVDDIKEPRWTYAISKIAGEKLCLSAGMQKDLDVVCLRPFNIYGPGQSGNGAVRDMILAALAGEEIVVHGNGEQVRAWCFIDDFITAALAAISTEGIGGEIINIGNPAGEATARELAQFIVEASGSESRITHKPHFGTDILYRTPDMAKAQKLLDFKPRIDLRAGLQQTAQWYREHG